MKMHITTECDGESWKDPLLNYLHNYIEVLSDLDNRDIAHDLPTLFRLITHLMEEFMNSNRGYRRPVGLSVSHRMPVCCPPSIRIEYLNQSLTIKTRP